jgi:hypothetical protein
LIGRKDLIICENQENKLTEFINSTLNEN